ncbi:hypothetical protein EGW08_000594 [Elysia chlorotica]|uniref:Uncharacterized protein n=1 Tax=Elysia chlorotica TaxID=188477 RepID=A0A433UCP3_ELYCH|nr:hypothetical protein EGW08_000594 [Elysia chlorotica]
MGAGGNEVNGSKRNVTSQGGGGGGGKDGGQFESETGDGEEGDGGIDDDTDETGRRRGTFDRRRGYIDSDESDESDESGRREYGRRNYNKRTKPYWANERMVQIHSLLDGMRRSRDYTRMQRLRMLIYILDKTQNEDLADLILGFDGAGLQREEEQTYTESRPFAAKGEGRDMIGMRRNFAENSFRSNDEQNCNNSPPPDSILAGPLQLGPCVTGRFYFCPKATPPSLLRASKFAFAFGVPLQGLPCDVVFRLLKCVAC